MNVNFAFLRHGHGCHNAVRSLLENEQITREDYSNMLGITADPELTPIGVDASVRNGCVVAKILRNIHVLEHDPSLNMQSVNIVGSSPLLRCMETAYYMTRKWQNPPSKIYVFPHLREIDESSRDIYSSESRRRMDTIPSYAMQTIEEQKERLREAGILEYFDFSFVEEDSDALVARKEPGDVEKFIDWFSKRVFPYVRTPPSSPSSSPSTPAMPTLNIFVTTHAGVLKHHAGRGFYNNSGFVLNTQMYPGAVIPNKTVGIDRYLPQMFFRNYNNPKYDKSYYCPSNRCGTLCKAPDTPVQHNAIPLNRIPDECTNTDDDNLTFTQL